MTLSQRAGSYVPVYVAHMHKCELSLTLQTSWCLFTCSVCSITFKRTRQLPRPLKNHQPWQKPCRSLNVAECNQRGKRTFSYTDT